MLLASTTSHTISTREEESEIEHGYLCELRAGK